MPHHLAITLADLLSQCTCQFHGDADVQKEVRDKPRGGESPCGEASQTGREMFSFYFGFGAKNLTTHPLKNLKET